MRFRRTRERIRHLLIMYGEMKHHNPDLKSEAIARRSVGAQAIGTQATGSLAVGALALGAAAIGALALVDWLSVV